MKLKTKLYILSFHLKLWHGHMGIKIWMVQQELAAFRSVRGIPVQQKLIVRLSSVKETCWKTFLIGHSNILTTHCPTVRVKCPGRKDFSIHLVCMDGRIFFFFVQPTTQTWRGRFSIMIQSVLCCFEWCCVSNTELVYKRESS